MVRYTNFFKKKITIVISIFLAVIGVIVGKKVYNMTATPIAEKDCNFIYPETQDQTKPTNLLVEMMPTTLEVEQRGGFINDASCLNQTAVNGIIKINKPEDVKTTLDYARKNKLKVTSSGQRHSMGGQSFIRNGLVMDMRGLNQMKLDKVNKVLTVQTGAKWSAVQEFLDKEGLSVKAMQSINIFTVGGTLSVNAHGVAHDPGPIAPTVRSMHIMLPSGQIVKANAKENSEVFHHALGGYGLFGVILDVDLDVVDNEAYTWRTDYIDYKTFPDFYSENVNENKDIGLMYARLSMSPFSYLQETAVHTFVKDPSVTKVPGLETATHDWINRFVINLSKTGKTGKWIRWTLEKYAEPSLHACITRNQAMSRPDEICDVSRNQEMYDAMGYLKNRLPDTDILQEYFIPQKNMPAFVDGLRRITQDNKANLLNCTIRIAHKDEITAMPYAKEDSFAFVLYFNQKLNEQDSKILRKTTTDLIDLATSLNGRFYLPYQLYYTPEQLTEAYPETKDFFQTKTKYDPEEMLTNTWYETYKNRI